MPRHGGLGTAPSHPQPLPQILLYMYNPGMAHFMPGGGARSRTDQIQMATTVAPLLAAAALEAEVGAQKVATREEDTYTA